MTFIFIKVIYQGSHVRSPVTLKLSHRNEKFWFPLLFLFQIYTCILKYANSCEPAGQMQSKVKNLQEKVSLRVGWYSTCFLSISFQNEERGSSSMTAKVDSNFARQTLHEPQKHSSRDGFCSITLLCTSLGESLLTKETFPVMKHIFRVVVLSVSEGMSYKIKWGVADWPRMTLRTMCFIQFENRSYD